MHKKSFVNKRKTVFSGKQDVIRLSPAPPLWGWRKGFSSCEERIVSGDNRKDTKQHTDDIIDAVSTDILQLVGILRRMEIIQHMGIFHRRKKV
ncbi:hypothetical protein CEXT_548011 [Caerostris extrusa]|uniref:Uncharacterized protein n=1 Tax=Caerostris extrusa TaxID=172846 RepID=A0AAV4NXS0_CAEEX|nr:hypothetical protein CEXT_548011 [Caerostris extrusa]